MNVRCLLMIFIISLTSVSIVQSADFSTAPSVIVPAFSWLGFYMGGQVGNFSSKVKINNFNKEVGLLSKDKTPFPSGVIGGFYAGYNIGLGRNVVFGIETDAILANQESIKTVFTRDLDNDPAAQDFNARFRKAGVCLIYDDEFTQEDSEVGFLSYKEKWSGAARLRVGFATAGHIMPYVSSGISYARMNSIFTLMGVRKHADDPVTATRSAQVLNDTTTMVGYTVGGGVDFAMTDNILLRAEYRYSDFGKKKFKNDNAEFQYKTNDFRVGMAYKF
ncbi:outer membrane protein [Bartonella sp. B10]